MIFEALSFLTEEINEYFRNKLKTQEDKVVLSAIVNADGTIAIEGANKLVITLINIEQDHALRNAPVVERGVLAQSNPLQVNLYVLFVAYFDRGNYIESLRFIYFVMEYFQRKNVFSQQNSPALDSRIDKLTVELQSPSQEQLNSIWGCLGAKYMPSVSYKISVQTIDESIIPEYRPPITGIDNNPLANPL